MELIRGRTLRDIIGREKLLTPVVAVELLTQMLDALHHAHRCTVPPRSTHSDARKSA
jgi:hypothetical protein